MKLSPVMVLTLVHALRSTITHKCYCKTPTGRGSDAPLAPRPARPGRAGVLPVSCDRTDVIVALLPPERTTRSGFS